MSVSTFTPVTANGDSAVVNLGSSAAAWVDLYIPNILNAAPEFDTGDLTFKYSVDGTNYKAVPGMTVADDVTGYIGRFLVWGSNLKYTAANLSGSAATVAPTVRVTPCSMCQYRDDWSFRSDVGVLNADSGSEEFSFGRVPDQILLDIEAGTWDSVDMTIQSTTDGTNWFDLDGTHATINDQYLVFNNPGKLTRFRLEWSAGGLSTVTMAIAVIGLTNQGEIGIKKDATVLATALEILTDSTTGTPDTAAPILVEISTGGSAADLDDTENNIATLGHHLNRVTVEVQRVVDALQANGVLPTR